MPDDAPLPAPAPETPAEGNVTPAPLAPPGTRHESFFERSVVQGAILTTLLGVFPMLREILIDAKPWIPAVLNFGENTVMTWAVAFGVVRVGAPGLRRS